MANVLMYNRIKQEDIHFLKMVRNMRYLANHEKVVRGTFDFPIELYYVDKANPRYEMPFHWHMEYELILVLQGVLHLSVDGEPFDLGAGDCMLIGEGAIHGGVPENCIYECVVFDLEHFFAGYSVCGQRLNRLIENNARLEGCFAAASRPAQTVSALFEAMETERFGYEFITTGLLWQFLGEILSDQVYRKGNSLILRDTRRTQAVKRALRRIREDYAEPLTLDDLAEEAELNPKYFCRVFRQLTGRTPIDYLLYYRVECAAELLCTTNDSVTDIGLSCGFGDASYFSRIFKRFKNQTPGEYRETHR